MRSTWMAAALAVVGLVGCGSGGGGDGGDGERTYLACGNEAGCLVMRSDAPATMSCSAPEVASCSTDGVLATCQQDQFPVHLTLYVYLRDALASSEADCTAQGGTWTLTPQAAGAP